MTAIKNGTLLVKDSNGNTARVATLSQTDITTLNTALTDIDANKRKISSISANYVTTNTAQTISAQKTFSYQSEPIHIKETRFDVSKTPSETVGNSIVTYDKNNKQVGYYQVLQESNGRNINSIYAVNYKTDGTLVRGSIRVGVNNKGDTYTYAPNPADDSNNTEIATTKFVNDKISSIGSNYVTTNTAQTITGKKTLTTTDKANVITVKATNTDSTVTPTENLWVNVVNVVDKNDIGMGNFQFVKQPDGGNWIGLQAVARNSNGNEIYHFLGISLRADGTALTSAPNPASNSNDTSIATTKWVRSYIMPAGTIIPFAGSNIPTGYLLCNGAVVSRTTYADLFRVIGTTYGAGDGSTTFKLPDLRDRFLEGAGTNAVGRYLSAGLPNITGDSHSATYKSYTAYNEGFVVCTKYVDKNAFGSVAHDGMYTCHLNFDARRANTIYSSSTTVQPNAVTVQYLIKY